MKPPVRSVTLGKFKYYQETGLLLTLIDFNTCETNTPKASLISQRDTRVKDGVVVTWRG